MADQSVLTAALAYAGRGWRVVPIRPGEKRPPMDAWQDAATTDEELIRDWWRRWPNHGVGIATGEQSGIFVLDVDVSGTKQGDDTLADLEATYGALPATVEVVTGSGGRHLYFRWPDGLDIRNDAGTRLGPGLDIRGEGGQVLAPPTRHPTGTFYLWEASGDPNDGVAPAEAPGWLLALLTAPTNTTPRVERLPYEGTPRPGDRFAAAVTWPELLTADGAEYVGTRTDRSTGTTYELWSRPGTDHTSATLYYGGTDLLKVFSSNWPGLSPDQTYTRFGYFVATRYQGNFARAAGDIAARQSVEEVERWALIESAPDQGVEAPESDADGLPTPIDWTGFWERENGPEWLVEPLIPVGRHVVLYAPAKEGKSLLALEVAVAAATGSAVLGNPAAEPLSVVYLDLEMTEDDLHERLLDMGYDETSDLSNLHYYSLPDLPPLDTKAGGDVVEAIVRRHDARLIVIDTMARVVQGEENSADTYRWFDMHTSLRMKALHVAVLRLDHAGKDVTKGQRGSSEKVGYADVVWQLKYDQETGAVNLKATHRRLGWVPETIALNRIEEPSLSHMMTVGKGFTVEEFAIARKLDDLGAPPGCSVRQAMDILKKAGGGHKNRLVAQAVKARKNLGNTPGNTQKGNNEGNPAPQNGTDPSDLRVTPQVTAGNGSSAPVGNTAPNEERRSDTHVPEPNDPPPFGGLF